MSFFVSFGMARAGGLDDLWTTLDDSESGPKPLQSLCSVRLGRPGRLFALTVYVVWPSASRCGLRRVNTA